MSEQNKNRPEPGKSGANKQEAVRVTSSSVKADVIRKFVSSGFVLGASTHSFEEAADAARKGANFVVFGPIFGTPGKPAPVGIESLSDIVSRLPATPVLAIGGIDDSNYQAVLDAGAAGFAGNIILGGVVGMAADAATGATLEHFPNPVTVTLTPLKKGEPDTVIKIIPEPPAPKPEEVSPRT